MDPRTPPFKALDSLSHLAPDVHEFSLSSTALDLSGTSAGFASSLPASPTTLSARDGSVSRRRLSWGRMQRQHVDMLDDPLRVDTSNAATTAHRSNQQQDEFDGRDADTPNEYRRPSELRSHFYGKLDGGTANASESSLIPEFRSKSALSSDLEYNDIDLDDDEARLTGLPRLSLSSSGGGSGGKRVPFGGPGGDVERVPMRKSLRYSTQPSTGDRLRSVKRSLHRMSVRVVNLASAGLEDKARGIRLPDDDHLEQRMRGKERADKDDREDGERDEYDGKDEDDDDEDLPDLAARLPIRGRTLGFLGSTSRLRLAMFRFLTYAYVHTPRLMSSPLYISIPPKTADIVALFFFNLLMARSNLRFWWPRWTEPVILVLIVFNAIVLTVQAARSITLPDATDSDPNPMPSAVSGYFHTWEDYALFILFILFTYVLYFSFSLRRWLTEQNRFM